MAAENPYSMLLFGSTDHVQTIKADEETVKSLLEAKEMLSLKESTIIDGTGNKVQVVLAPEAKAIQINENRYLFYSQINFWLLVVCNRSCKAVTIENISLSAGV